MRDPPLCVRGGWGRLCWGSLPRGTCGLRQRRRRCAAWRLPPLRVQGKWVRQCSGWLPRGPACLRQRRWSCVAWPSAHTYYGPGSGVRAVCGPRRALPVPSGTKRRATAAHSCAAGAARDKPVRLPPGRNPVADGAPYHARGRGPCHGSSWPWPLAWWPSATGFRPSSPMAPRLGAGQTGAPVCPPRHQQRTGVQPSHGGLCRAALAARSVEPSRVRLSRWRGIQSPCASGRLAIRPTSSELSTGQMDRDRSMVRGSSVGRMSHGHGPWRHRQGRGRPR